MTDESGLRTVWRITAARDVEHRRRHLGIQIAVETIAPFVIDAIEQAAANHGIELERISPREDA